MRPWKRLLLTRTWIGANLHRVEAKQFFGGRGAACLAGLVRHLRGKKVVLPHFGGNTDTSTLGRILERGLAHDGRVCRMTVTISDRPGGLSRFSSIIGDKGGSIIEIDHDRAFASDDITLVVVHCVIETRDQAHILAIKQRLGAKGFAQG